MSVKLDPFQTIVEVGWGDNQGDADNIEYLTGRVNICVNPRPPNYISSDYVDDGIAYPIYTEGSGNRITEVGFEYEGDGWGDFSAYDVGGAFVGFINANVTQPLPAIVSFGDWTLAPVGIDRPQWHGELGGSVSALFPEFRSGSSNVGYWNVYFTGSPQRYSSVSRPTGYVESALNGYSPIPAGVVNVVPSVVSFGGATFEPIGYIRRDTYGGSNFTIPITICTALFRKQA